jgi:hypothetical protein
MNQQLLVNLLVKTGQLGTPHRCARLSNRLPRSSLITAFKPTNHSTKKLALEMHKMADDQQLIYLLVLYKFICHGYCLVVNDF